MKHFALAIVAILVVTVGLIWWMVLRQPEDEEPREQVAAISEQGETMPVDIPKPPPLPVAAPVPIDIIPEPPSQPPARTPEEKRLETKNVTIIPAIIISKARAMKDHVKASKLLYESAYQIKHSNPIGAMTLCDEVIDLLDSGEAYREKAEKLKALILGQ